MLTHIHTLIWGLPESKPDRFFFLWSGRCCEGILTAGDHMATDSRLILGHKHKTMSKQLHFINILLIHLVSILLIRTFINFCITASLLNLYKSLMRVFALPGLLTCTTVIHHRANHKHPSELPTVCWLMTCIICPLRVKLSLGGIALKSIVCGCSARLYFSGNNPHKDQSICGIWSAAK